MRVEREGGTAPWLAGTLAAPCVQGQDCLRCKTYDPIRVFFRASCSWRSEGLFGQSFSIALPIQELRGLPCLRSFSVSQHVRHIEGLPWLGSYSVHRQVRPLVGQPLCCSAAGAGSVGSERLWWWLHPLHVTQRYGLASMASQVSYHRHFLPQSPPSRPLNPPLHSQQQFLPWDCSTIPKLHLLAAAPSRGPASLSGVCMAAARTVWFSFHLGCHRSAVSLSALNVSPLTQTIALMWGSDPCFSSPTHWGQVQSY